MTPKKVNMNINSSSLVMDLRDLIPDNQAQYNYSPVYQEHGVSLPYAPQCHDENGVVTSYFQPHHFVAVHHHSAAMIPQNLSQDFFFDQSQKFYDQVNEPQLHMQHQYPNSSERNCPNLCQQYIEVQKRRSRRSKRRFRRSRQRSCEFNAQQSDKASPNSCHELMDIKICSNKSSDISTIATIESSSVKTNM